MKRWLPILLLLALLAPAALARAQTLRVDFYDMGKADAMLITAPDGSRILIDAATNKGGEALANRLKRAGVTAIDLMLITHFDKDHVGGADKILEALPVRQVVMPLYHKESKQYDQFIEALESSPQTEVLRMAAGETLDYAFGDAVLRLESALRTDYGSDEENDFSIAAFLTYGDTRFLFPGDAEDARQTELLLGGDVACDVLKVPYHGRLVDVSAAFLAACKPQIAFIPDSDKDPADPLVVRFLQDAGAQVYSARDGSIAVVSDGETVRAEK